jgi:hypothetical protein
MTNCRGCGQPLLLGAGHGNTKFHSQCRWLSRSRKLYVGKRQMALVAPAVLESLRQQVMRELK